MKKKNYINKMKGKSSRKDLNEIITDGGVNLEKCPQELIDDVINMAIRTGNINKLRCKGKGVSAVMVNLTDDNNLNYCIKVYTSGKMTGVDPSGRKLNQDQCRQILKENGVIE